VDKRLNDRDMETEKAEAKFYVSEGVSCALSKRKLLQTRKQFSQTLNSEGDAYGIRKRPHTSYDPIHRAEGIFQKAEKLAEDKQDIIG
jgi:hypothetical protein